MAGQSARVPLWYGIAGGSVANLASAKFDPYNWLEVWLRISGYAGNSIAQLRFNGDTGTTAYASTTGTNTTAVVSQTSGTASGIKVSAVSATAARPLVRFLISNISGRAHGIEYSGSDQSEAAGTAPQILRGAGVWATTAQITQITLNDGGQNLLVGTDMAIWGFQGL